MERSVAVPDWGGVSGPESLRLLAALDEFRRELGGGAPPDPPTSPKWPPVAALDAPGSRLLEGLRDALAAIAATCRPERSPHAERVAQAALDGALLTARTDLLLGGAAELRRLIPDLAYLVVLPVAGEGEACRVYAAAARRLGTEVARCG